nr:hypothetical protein [Tanacetum cinerariifolium]
MTLEAYNNHHNLGINIKIYGKIKEQRKEEYHQIRYNLLSSSGYPASTRYNSGGYASAVAAAVQAYPGQNSYRPLMNRLPPIQGDMLTVETMVHL